MYTFTLSIDMYYFWELIKASIIGQLINPRNINRPFRTIGIN